MPDTVTGATNAVTATVADDVSVSSNTEPKEPSKWGKVFGSIIGGVTNILAPNPGGILGSIVRRSADTQQMMSFQRVIDQSMQHSWNMVMVQKKVQDQALEVNMVSNLLKTRHDGHMSAVQNIKS
ncbi:MAG: hypothetical protein U0Y68_09850 [Blastocatellia bacterium]